MTRRLNGKAAPDRDFTALTQVELAAVHGVTSRTVHRWTSSGLPRRDDGTYCAADTIAWRIAREAGTGDLDLSHERARLAAAQAEKVERENALAAGQLIYASHASAAWGQILVAIKSGVLALPSRVAPYIDDPLVRAQVVALLEDRVHEVLSELAESDPLAESPPED